MKMDRPKEWFEKSAAIEGDSCVQAGVPSAHPPSELRTGEGALAVRTGWVQLTTEKWGWSLLRIERMTITRGNLSNRYYGLKLLGLKIMAWCRHFDGHAPNK